MVDDRRKATKRVEDLESELAAAVAKELAATVTGSESIILHKHRIDDTVNVVGFLSSISNAFTAAVADSASPPSYLLLLSSSPSAQTTTTTTVLIIFGSDEKKVKAAGDALKTRLSVKGGGKGTKWSGKWTGVWKDAREGAIADEILKQVCDV